MPSDDVRGDRAAQATDVDSDRELTSAMTPSLRLIE